MPSVCAITLTVVAVFTDTVYVYALQHAGGTSERQAAVLLAEHRDDEAAKLLTEMLAAHPENVDALTLLARVREDQSQNDVAFELLVKALRISPNAPRTNVAMGQLLLSEHRYPEAMDRFETVLAVDVRNDDARRGESQAAIALAMLSRSEGHAERALLALEHACEKLPDDPQLLLDLGMQASDLGKVQESFDALRTAHALAPGDGNVVYALARVEMIEQDMPAAERDLRAYLAQRPEDASAHYGLGRVLELQQRTEDARAEFARSVALQPVQTESYYELGQMYLDAHQDTQAEAYFRKVLARDSSHGGALTGMGVLLFRGRQFAEAEQFLLRAEKTAPEYQPAHYYRGLALARMGRKADADEELAAAVDLDRQQQAPPATKGADGAAMVAPLR